MTRDKVLVTGASGFVGSAVAQALAQSGYAVRALLRPTAQRRNLVGFDAEIVEVHHRAKADAPSGTAMRLAREIQDVRSGGRLVHGRQGMVGARGVEELAVLAVRGGDVVGDHTVHLLGPGERLELTHRATSREVLARGALRAAQVLVGRPPGRYGIAELLSDG